MQEYNNNDGDLNPEVQLELEKLNTSSAQINELENILQEYRHSYYETLSKCSSGLLELSSKIGPPIIKTRPYFELKRQQKEIQKESQVAAARYEAACTEMTHADAVVSKSEAIASESSKLDDNTMEILNIAISKVNLSKLKKNEAHKEYQKYLNLYIDMEKNIHQLEKKHKNDIKKSKPYYDYRKAMTDSLKESKVNINIYEDKVKSCKMIYNETLQRLENISDNIHLSRKNRDLLGPRGEGVGAEIDNVELMKDNESVLTSRASELNSCEHKSTSTVISPNLSNVNLKIKKRSSLVSATPIVDGLLKAASSNYFINYSHPSELSYRMTHPKLPYKNSVLEYFSNFDPKTDDDFVN